MGPGLVVARDDHPLACIFEQYLRRTEYVTGWQIGRIHSARQPKRLAIGDRHSAVLLAVTQRHDGDSLGRSHGTAMPAARMIRSEEHTSELQSLMRISYAVFCLKKKNQTHRQQPAMNYYHLHLYTPATTSSHPTKPHTRHTQTNHH